MSNKAVIVFSGYNQRAVLAFLRTLRRNNVNYAIIAASKDDNIYKSGYRDKVISQRETNDLNISEFLPLIENVQNYLGAEEYLIAPSSEAFNRFFLSHIEFLEAKNITIPLVNFELYSKISDKWSFSELCYKHGIGIPVTFESFEDAKLPFVAKPRYYYSRNEIAYKPQLFFSEDDRIRFSSSYNLEDFYFQEFVEGRSIYLLYYFHRNGEVYRFSQENLVQQPNGGSIICAIGSDFHLGQISQRFETMLIELGFHGLIMIEIKYQGEDRYQMIEANPRFWGPSQLFVDAEKNFFETLLSDYGLLDKKVIFSDCSDEIVYHWFGGVMAVLRSKQKLVFHLGNKSSYWRNIVTYLKGDVYLRDDSIDIFQDELV